MQRMNVDGAWEDVGTPEHADTASTLTAQGDMWTETAKHRQRAAERLTAYRERAEAAQQTADLAYQPYCAQHNPAVSAGRNESDNQDRSDSGEQTGLNITVFGVGLALCLGAAIDEVIRYAVWWLTVMGDKP